MKRTYGEGWQSFEANADIIQIYTPNDYFTAEHFSKRIGDMTVSTAPNSFQSTPFLSPPDLMNLDKKWGLVFSRNLKYPILTTRFNYFELTESEFFWRWDIDYFPFPHPSGHIHPHYPADLVKYEYDRAEGWREAWRQGRTDKQFWKGGLIP